MISKSAVERRAQTTLDLPAPVEQGTSTVITSAETPVGTVAELNNCAVTEPIKGKDFWRLSEQKEGARMLYQRKTMKETVHVRVFPSSVIVEGTDRPEIILVKDQENQKAKAKAAGATKTRKKPIL